MLTDIRNELLNLEIKVHDMTKTLKEVHKLLQGNVDADTAEQIDIKIVNVLKDMGIDFIND